LKLARLPGKVITCLLLVGACQTNAFSQVDTILLEHVTIVGNDPARFLPGGKRQVIFTDSLANQNLAQIIEAQAPVYFIQYGAPGQLSSINLRGLGANRTSLLWQGMEINSFTLGQTDFSEISAGNGDKIRLYYGGVGAMFGNGALGGTIGIDSEPLFDEGHGYSLNSSIGSFGQWGTNVGYRFSSKRLSIATKVYHRQANNDFQYEINGNTRIQDNAGFRHYGLLQDLVFKVNAASQLSLHFWYNHHYREVQPSKYDFSADEELESDNARISLLWETAKNNWYWKFQTGYSEDSQLFDQSELIRLQRWFGSFESEWERSRYLTLRLGGNLNYLKPEVDTYQDNTKEIRSELFASVVWEKIQNLSLGLSLRAPMADGDFKSLSPLFSGSYVFYQSQSIQVSADFQAGKSYRLPTMNDSYWQPGGNPELDAETSKNLEAGLGLGYRKNQLNWDMNVRAFRHDVNNWIIWVPGGRGEDSDGEVVSFWYPDNIREVLAYGVDYQQVITWKSSNSGWETVFDINGIYNRAQNKNLLSPVDRSKDKQLPYTPEHVVNGNWRWNYQPWELGVLVQYRSKRYVETNNELPPLSAYTLWRFSAGRSGRLGPVKWVLQLQVDNAFDKTYETFANRAMPGRNYKLNLSLTYN
jgi:iron complex outermembrane receptor protein